MNLLSPASLHGSSRTTARSRADPTATDVACACVSGSDQVVFIRCTNIVKITDAIDVMLRSESPLAARRVDVAEVTVGTKWSMLDPIEPDFFIGPSGDTVRIARLAALLKAPGFQLDVRDTVPVLLAEANAEGELRITGTARPRSLPMASSQLGFELLPVRPETRSRIQGLAGSPALSRYVGKLAGFPDWQRRSRVTSELIVFEN